MSRSPFRRSAVVATGLVMALTLAACGDSKDDAADSTSSTTTAAETTTSAAAAETTSAAAETTSAAAETTSAAAETTSAAAETSTAAAGGGYKEGLKIAFLPKQLNNPYTDVSVGGGKEATEELKGEYKLVGPNDAAASSQVSYVNTLIQQQQDVIVVAANDKDALCPSLNKAREAGIKVVSFDSDASPACRDVFINQATTDGIGKGLVESAARLAGGEGEIAILSATANATNQNSWIEAMKEELKKPEYAKIKLVKTAYGNDDDQKSFQEAQGLLQSYPNLKVIVSPTTVGIAAASRYVSGSKYKGKVQITGLGLPSQMREWIKDGTVSEFALWKPADIGYLAAQAGAALASETITGKEGDKFTAGRLGEYTVGKDGEVVLGPPTVFNKDNIDEFTF